MSEENKNQNKDKGKQKNVINKYDTTPKNEKHRDVEIAEETEFLNIEGKKNKRKRK